MSYLYILQLSQKHVDIIKDYFLLSHGLSLNVLIDKKDILGADAEVNVSQLNQLEMGIGRHSI